MNYLKTIFLCINLTFMGTGMALIKAPNYNFSLKSFEPFMPGANIVEIKKSYPEIKLSSKTKKSEIYKLMVDQLNYMFPVYIQVLDKKVVDFYARLPQYFLHDLFHQSIINKIGIQDKYKKVDEHAVYQWNKEKRIYTYEGACTITCFALYYSVSIKDIKIESLLSKMNSQASKVKTH